MLCSDMETQDLKRPLPVCWPAVNSLPISYRSACIHQNSYKNYLEHRCSIVKEDLGPPERDTCTINLVSRPEDRDTYRLWLTWIALFGAVAHSNVVNYTAFFRAASMD